jgi:hypothetical protein
MAIAITMITTMSMMMTTTMMLLLGDERYSG